MSTEQRTICMALANLPFPATPDDAVARSVRAIADAGAQHAAIVCFPEAYVPVYRAPGRNVPPADGGFLERACRTWAPGSERRVFEAGPLRFGIASCHAGWR